MPKPKITPWEFRQKYTKKPLSKTGKQLKLTQIKKKVYKIAPVSKKRKEQLKQYGPEAKQFKLDHPVCELQLEGCTQVTTEVHHPEGREGKKLLNLSICLGTCHNCHRIITDNSKMAMEQGFSLKRNTSIRK